MEPVFGSVIDLRFTDSFFKVHNIKLQILNKSMKEIHNNTKLQTLVEVRAVPNFFVLVMPLLYSGYPKFFRHITHPDL